MMKRSQFLPIPILKTADLQAEEIEGNSDL